MQRSLGLMALDVAAKRAGLSSSPELTSPVSSGPCSPLEPAAASVLGMAAFPLYNPVLQLKAVADGTSRLMSLHHHQQQQLQQQQHHHHLAALQQQLRQQSKGSPPLSLFPTSNSLSPSSSPLQASGHQPLSPQASRLPGSPGDDAHHSNSKSIKFSIDNILSPAFGGKVEGILMPEKSVKKSSSKRAFDISALTGEAPSAKRPPALPHPEPQKARAPVAKRKNSSDSESSTTSSTFSSASDKKNAKKGRKESSANSHASSPASNCNEPVLNLDGKDGNIVWPAWVYCTRYSDRPSSGPRSRRSKKKEKKADEKRPRTAFTAEQLARLKQEFQENRYLTEKRRQDLARDLKLNESQIKIWFQNKRAKIKKANGARNPLALHLMAQGLYNHTTSVADEDEVDMDDDDLDDMVAEAEGQESCSSHSKQEP